MRFASWASSSCQVQTIESVPDCPKPVYPYDIGNQQWLVYTVNDISVAGSKNGRGSPMRYVAIAII